MDVGNGVYDLVIVFGAETMTQPLGGLGPMPEMVSGMMGGGGGGGEEGGGGGGAIQAPEGKMFLADAGMLFPAFFAMLTKRHMYDFGTTAEQIAMVSVQSHKHGAMNPYASYQKEVTLEEVLNSRIICDPVHLLEICPNTDGGSAVILASEDVARRYTTKPVEVRACSLIGPVYKGKVLPNSIQSTVIASRQAYETAGMGPEDIDMVEMHDDSAAFEVFTYEDLGFCKKGEGGPAVERGDLDYGGKVVFSPSGGLQSKGHPLGATGCAQLFEMFHQLRGECGARQVEGAKVGLVHNGGGLAGALEPMVMCIAILSR
jgi:acetyl-CoA acetyltransferase